MNKCRLKYKNETGNYPSKGNNSSLHEGYPVDIEYQEWLERKYELLLEFAELVNTAVK